MAEELNLSEQSLDSTPTQTSDLSSDLSFLENFSPALAAKPEAIDTYKYSVGNPVTGSNPATKVSTIDNSEAINSILNNSISKVEKGGDNPYERMRPFTYNGDYDGANFERYYSTEAYKTLGFSPYRDNDALYNNKMTMGDQFVRAASQWDNLALTGFKSGVKSWGTLFTDPLAPDIQGAKEMERAMAIGSVTTGGFGGFAANTFLNSAYTIGIAGEFLGEELALTAATAFSGGLLGEVTVPGMVAKAGMATRQFLKLGELGAKLGKTGEKFAEGKKLFEAGENLANIGRNIDKSNNVASTRDFFNKAVTGAFDVINPLENTVNAFRKTDYATDLAKTIGRSGAFIDDILHIKTAVSEAQLEGGMVKINATKELIDQYRKENGKDPEGEELNKIEMLASEEARRTAFWNLPAIMTSNKLLYSTMMLPISKMMGKASTRLIEDIVAEGGVKALGKDMFKVVGEGAGEQIKAAAKSLAKPKIYGQYGMNYLKANFAEGIQENIQEAISQGAIQHALATQSDPRMAAYQGYMGYFLDGMKSQLSAQGAETFAGGFAMGMFAQPIMAAPAWAASKSVDLFKDKTKLAEAKAIRDTALNAQRDTLNDLANNDLKYWAPDIMNAVKNGSLSDDLFAAARVGDHKSTKDSKDNIQFNHIATAIQSGKFETLMEKLADYKNLTPDEAFDVLQKYGIGVTTKEEAAKALDYIDDVIARANQIKNDYEDVAQSFPNPINITQYEKGTSAYNAAVTSYLAWEEAKTNLVFAKNTYKTYSNRVKGMTDAFSTLSNGIANVDAQAVMSTLSTSGLQTEIQTLKKEISSLTDIPEQASVRKDKEKKLELLQNFQESIKEAQDKITSENITDYLEKQKVYIKTKKDFQKFLTYLAKKNDNILFNSDADKAFGLLTDTLEMKNEMQGLANSINILNDPRGFVNLQSRIYEALEADKPNRVNKIANNLNNFLLMKDENQVLVELGKQGLKLPEDFLKKYKEALEAGEELPVPEYFIDPQTGEELTPESNPEKYEKAKDLWITFKAWLELNNPPKAKAAEVEESPEAAAGEEEYKTFSPELKATIDSIYKDANAKESIGSFIKTNPDAILAIKLAKTQENLEKQEEDAKLNATKKEEGIPLGTKVNPEARGNLNLMGYTNTQIDGLSREDREKILLGGITAEEFYKVKSVEVTTTTDAKADIEKRRQEDLESNASSIRVKVETYNTLTINGNPVQVEITTNKDGSRVLKARTINEDGSIDPMAFVTERINNGSQLSLTNEKLIEGYIGNEDNTLKKVSEDLNPSDARTNKINAKYDAELAALEGKPAEPTKEAITEKFIPVPEGYQANMKYGRKGIFSTADRKWMFFDKNNKQITNKNQVKKLTEELSSMLGIASTWWRTLISPAEREQARTSFEKLYNLYNAGFSGSAENFEVDNMVIMLQALQGVKFKRGSDVSKNVADVSSKWLSNTGMPIDTFVTEQLKDAFYSYGMPLPGEEDELINLVYDIINDYPQGIRDKDIKAYMKDANPNRDLIDLKEDFAIQYGLDVERTFDILYNLNLLDYEEKQEGEPSEVTGVPGENVETEELEREPTKIIQPEYEGKIIFMTPGSGKEDLAKQDKDIIDADDILIETIREIKPDYPISEQLDNAQNIYEAIRYGGINRDQLYNITRAKLKQMAESGKTILTSSVAFMKDADYVMIQQNKDLVKKDYDMMKEYTELNNLPSTISYIAITEPASEVLKKTPLELLGRGPLELEKDVETEPVTIEDINKNLTTKNLQIAMEKGYDAIYKNNRYAITNVEENSVSLKAIDGTTMKVAPEEISSVVNSEAVQATEEQIDIFDTNQKFLKTGGFELNDDIDSLDDTLNDINNNLCD